MEEDIEILEKLLDEGFEAMCYEEAQAIKHILSDYKRLQDEFEQVDHECDRLEQKENKLEKGINSLMQSRKKWKNRYYKVRKQLREKEKIIDLMANHIATNDSNLCQYLDMTMKCKYYAGENGKICDECIKEYFENKAKEVK